MSINKHDGVIIFVLLLVIVSSFYYVVSKQSWWVANINRESNLAALGTCAEAGYTRNDTIPYIKRPGEIKFRITEHSGYSDSAINTRMTEWSNFIRQNSYGRNWITWFKDSPDNVSDSADFSIPARWIVVSKNCYSDLNYTLFHEGGHVLGLSHAASMYSCASGTCTYQGYGNPYDYMAGQQSNGRGQHSLASRELLGWVNGIGTPRITSVTENGTYTIGNINTNVDTNPKGLKILARQELALANGGTDQTPLNTIEGGCGGTCSFKESALKMENNPAYIFYEDRSGGSWSYYVELRSNISLTPTTNSKGRIQYRNGPGVLINKTYTSVRPNSTYDMPPTQRVKNFLIRPYGYEAGQQFRDDSIGLVVDILSVSDSSATVRVTSSRDFGLKIDKKIYTDGVYSFINYPNGSTVSGKLQVKANSQSLARVKDVQFYVDDLPMLDQADYAPPYCMELDTSKLSYGQHTIKALATYHNGQVDSVFSSPMIVTVDNTTTTTSGGIPVYSPTARLCYGGYRQPAWDTSSVPVDYQ